MGPNNLSLPVDMNWLIRNAPRETRYGPNESVEIPIPNSCGYGKFYLRLYRMDRKEKTRRVDLFHCSSVGSAWLYLGGVLTRNDLITLAAMYNVSFEALS